jgi:hypothetical protein
MFMLVVAIREALPRWHMVFVETLNLVFKAAQLF